MCICREEKNILSLPELIREWRGGRNTDENYLKDCLLKTVWFFACAIGKAVNFGHFFADLEKKELKDVEKRVCSTKGCVQAANNLVSTKVTIEGIVSWFWKISQNSWHTVENVRAPTTGRYCRDARNAALYVSIVTVSSLLALGHLS